MQNKIMCVGNNRLVHPPLRRADGDISVFAVSALLAAGAYELALTTEGARPDTAQNTLLIQVRFVPALRDSPEGRRRPSRVFR
jgi:hypothetical protein